MVSHDVSWCLSTSHDVSWCLMVSLGISFCHKVSNVHFIFINVNFSVMSFESLDVCKAAGYGEIQARGPQLAALAIATPVNLSLETVSIL